MPSSFRPIMPSTAPPPILPRPETSSNDKSWLNTTLNMSSNIKDKGPSNALPSADLRVRRKEQNRAAQRAFRERKERYVKELEDRIKEIEAAHAIKVAQLEKENEELRAALRHFQSQETTYSMSPNKKKGQKRSLSLVDDHSSPPSFSDTQSPVITTPPTTLQRVPSSAVACIRDKDGISFCERLKEEVCSNAYNQLLTEPLFDSHGFLNETIASHPVPIVTSEAGRERSKSEIFNEMQQALTDHFLQNSSPTVADDFISCSEVWAQISAHPDFDQFDVEELCDEVRKRAKCSRTGPVFEEHDVTEVLEVMESRLKSKQS
ncbi:uncharacterized protein B0P05DRAFT_575123 [Gilbertella persicaria]|uniref:uncharacterized protein n=1 Tax=Gilbertella persicaria TaxID=101096 RepID=UPI00221EFEEE|nr:uncharacterized protein B0P05DRAFT_575123 [Gilbertella persicaria]KAI8057534.1 hypothetical protein B0P05DRAFT_575123 [Gilbertella persicaria]